jgi:hypothetical protein
MRASAPARAGPGRPHSRMRGAARALWRAGRLSGPQGPGPALRAPRPPDHDSPALPRHPERAAGRAPPCVRPSGPGKGAPPAAPAGGGAGARPLPGQGTTGKREGFSLVHALCVLARRGRALFQNGGLSAVRSPDVCGFRLGGHQGRPPPGRGAAARDRGPVQVVTRPTQKQSSRSCKLAHWPAAGGGMHRARGDRPSLVTTPQRTLKPRLEWSQCRRPRRQKGKKKPCTQLCFRCMCLTAFSVVFSRRTLGCPQLVRRAAVSVQPRSSPPAAAPPRPQNTRL